MFVVTNKDDSPYLTEVDSAGKRSGFFFLGPQEAVKALNDIRAFDPRATLSVVSLDSIFFDISRTAEEAAKAPQPAAGTSTDMRLFRLRRLEDEAVRAAEKKSSLAADDVPLFYDETLLLPVNGEQQRPYFFRLPDLKKVYEQQSGSKLKELPSVRVTTLATLTAALMRGAAEGPPPLFVAASEAAAVVERMNGAAATSDASNVSEGAGKSKTPSPDREQDDPFYLGVPFGGAKKKGLFAF